MKYLLLVLSMPTENATVRMRVWRALKSSGAAVLRDGVYLMPNRDECRATLDDVAADVRAGSGTAHVMAVAEPSDVHYAALFDRSADYGELLADIRKVQAELLSDNALETLKQSRKLRKSFTALDAIDFFPGEARAQADAALQELELAANRALSLDEPHAISSMIPARRIADFQGRTWATRRRPC